VGGGPPVEVAEILEGNFILIFFYLSPDGDGVFCRNYFFKNNSVLKQLL